MYANGEKTRAVVFALGLSNADGTPVRLALDGVDPAKTYVVNEINRGARRHGYDRRTVSGRVLREEGLAFTLGHCHDSAVFELEVR